MRELQEFVMAWEHERAYDECVCVLEALKRPFLLEFQPLDCDYPGLGVLLSSVRLRLCVSDGILISWNAACAL